MLHKDLKPQNIFLKKENKEIVIKIGDFGISKTLESAEDYRHTMICTPFYAAPELFENKQYSSWGIQYDIWSLGVILYKLLTLKYPFISDNSIKQCQYD